jgi:transcriptional regulator with XRE-family HTH domain
MTKRGRKTGFNEKIQSTILRLLEDGKTEEQIAEIVGVSKTTLNNWKGKHPDFMISVRESRLIADELVEASLLSRALGYSHPEEKVHFDKDGFVHTHETIKHYPPDTTAQMFWLRNRQSKRWREKTEGDVTVKVQAGTLTDEELDAKIAEKMAKAEKKEK